MVDGGYSGDDISSIRVGTKNCLVLLREFGDASIYRVLVDLIDGAARPESRETDRSFSPKKTRDNRSIYLTLFIRQGSESSAVQRLTD